MLDLVRDGKFLPDEIRGKRWPSRKKSAVLQFEEKFPIFVAIAKRFRIVKVESFNPADPALAEVAQGPDQDGGDLEPASSEVSISDSESDGDVSVPPHPPAEVAQDGGPDLMGKVLARMNPSAVGPPSSSSSSQMVARNMFRGTIHRLSPEVTRACCGEVLGDRFELVPMPANAWPLCRRVNCFGGPMRPAIPLRSLVTSGGIHLIFSRCRARIDPGGK